MSSLFNRFCSRFQRPSRIIVLISVLLALFPNVSFAAIWTINYPKQPVQNSIHAQYIVDVLELALQKTGVRYELVESQDVLLQGKAFKLLSNNRTVNVVWSMTDDDREEDFLPIRIPLYKGLIGWRVLLVNPDKLSQLESSKLRDNYAVQGMDWPDTKILQANGFNVVSATNYDEAFTIMHRKQADMFPRSIIEVFGELAQPELTKDLVIEPNFVLQYPAATYFFVNKRDVILGKLLSTGLEMAVEDGSLDKLFDATYSQMLQQLGLNKRTLLTLKNPLLPINTPLTDKALWYQINQ
ncbi:MAG: amino acid ABC transporter substrate-binding protein [Glaciecola sp.]|nr:amino acid ABC transporter substrate-binding protein [Glaciecola sp.]MDG1816734.1 amino acid ABC transporter substrate-binding protein [Glaciecola sp.]MDG2098885.1 amino acid ABC transporter substrate-binding protein [Glaciecola sp.]